ncbi:Hypothetical predicted protein [Pelobates cultripes]|uniref:Uncharacterized protein n=1 Tax=Pelobates cultripes TaxID=61616 RepID=A0AAD1RHB3_PELCU|nr:Hypothetical predicted protein [Pelobates cultripes]
MGWGRKRHQTPCSPLTWSKLTACMNSEKRILASLVLLEENEGGKTSAWYRSICGM